MSGNDEKLLHKWGVIKGQLIALCALNKLPKDNNDFKKFLCEEIDLRNLNSQTFNSFCYYILGIIDFEERDKMIFWPIINIKTNTKFRKGVSALVHNLQEKYPWSNIKKLPESYFLNPHAYQSKVVDFIMRLSNLAIHIALDDPELLFMHSGDGLNSRDVKLMTEIIVKAREEEEQYMRFNVLPIKKFEDVKKEIVDKCIALRQENDDLEQQLSSLKMHAVNKQLVPHTEIIDIRDKKIDIRGLKVLRDKKLSELNILNEELSKYFVLSQELLSKIKALKNPLSLSSKDFGCAKSCPDLSLATSRVCEDLCYFFQQITLKNSTKEEMDAFYDKLKLLKESLVKENEALNSFFCNVSLRQKT